MTRTYETTEGDMLDYIAFKVYRDESMAQMILKENPGLVDQPAVLPRGIKIRLPDAPEKEPESAIKSVWG